MSVNDKYTCTICRNIAKCPKAFDQKSVDGFCAFIDMPLPKSHRVKDKPVDNSNIKKMTIEDLRNHRNQIRYGRRENADLRI